MVNNWELEQTLTAERNLMLAWAFERSSDGIIVTDLKGIILMANDGFCTMFEYPRDEVIGQHTGLLKSEYSTQDFYRQMWKSLAERGQWKGEIVNRTKHGTEKICFLTITPIVNDGGTRIGYLGVEIDLTERKKFESAIAHGKQLAAIGEAMSTLAHEIRNPLNGIRMNAFLLEKAKHSGEHWTEDDAESITLINREISRLQDLVNSVLTFSRKQTLHYERVLVADLISEVLELVHFQVEQDNVAMLTEIQDATFTLRCDPNLLKQVLINLVQNAVEEAAEYSLAVANSEVGGGIPLGRVLIRCSEQETSDHELSVSGMIFAIDVLNSGRVLGRSEQQQLFKPFFTTKAQGLGLGLAASLKIVRQHGGTILLSSPVEEHGFASGFSVLLPL